MLSPGAGRGGSPCRRVCFVAYVRRRRTRGPQLGDPHQPIFDSDGRLALEQDPSATPPAPQPVTILSTARSSRLNTKPVKRTSRKPVRVSSARWRTRASTAALNRVETERNCCAATRACSPKDAPLTKSADLGRDLLSETLASSPSASSSWARRLRSTASNPRRAKSRTPAPLQPLRRPASRPDRALGFTPFRAHPPRREPLRERDRGRDKGEIAVRLAAI